jgi:thioredoxin 1
MLRILYFTANWCAPCRAFGPIVDSVASSYNGVSYQKIDIDSSPDLVNRYGITSVPTILLEKDGAVVARRSGASSQSDFARFIESHK